MWTYYDRGDGSAYGVDALIEEALRYQELGFDTFKWRPGTDWQEAKINPQKLGEICRQLRQAVGPDFKLGLEKKGYDSWTVEECLEMAPIIDELGFYFFEQPMGDEGPRQFDDYLKIKEQMPRVMLWGGERFHSYQQAEPWMRANIYDAVQSDCLHLGLTQNWRIAQLAAVTGTKIVPHNWSTSLGTMCNTHLVAAVPSGHMCEFFMYPTDFRYGLFKKPYRPQNGCITLAEEPGFGMELVDDFAEKFPYIPGPNTLANPRFPYAWKNARAREQQVARSYATVPDMEMLNVPQGQFALGRYPRRRRDDLRAWDAADEYLLHMLDEKNLPGKEANVLVLNDSFGALCIALSQHRPQLLSDSYLAQQGARENLSDNHLDATSIRLLNSLQEPAGKIDLLLIKIPKSLAFLEDQLYRVRPHLHAKTQIFGAGMVRNIHTSALMLFERLIGPTHTSLAKKKARLVYCQFDANKDIGNSPYPTEYQLENARYSLCNHANVFSRDSLDIGTRLFLEHIPTSTTTQKIADLGCGNGVIGLIAAERNPQARLIFVDESFMAVESARSNFAAAFDKKTIAQFHFGDGLANCPPNSLDLVLNNPPFHQQRAIDEAVPWRMFSQSKAALKKGGELWVIGNRHLDHHVKLKRLFGHCETVASSGKFVVLKVVKR
jgi:16S rRNA (guanine1207-N2)-methyltransferase